MKAVVFGAGKIGRGFLTELVYRSGGETTLVDTFAPLTEMLNKTGSYPLLLTGENGWKRTEISRYRAIPTSDSESVAEAVSEADVLFTAVGLANLSGVAPLIAEGLHRREIPVNVLVCENGMEAVPILREAVLSLLPGDAESRFGFAEVSVGRMVPVAPAELVRAEPLLVCAEPYYSLPVDEDALCCPLPAIEGIEGVSPFELILERKLYMQNMSHAVCAYLGARLGYETIWQAMGDMRVRRTVDSALRTVAHGLSKRHHVPVEPLLAHADELLARYDNRLLGDTVARVGRDTRRKLGPTDRLCGALKVCGVECIPLCAAIAAGFLFTGDEVSDKVTADAALSIERALETYCGITDSHTATVISKLYGALRENPEQVIESIC